MDEGGTVDRKKRTGWVWAICIYYSLSLVSGIVMFCLMYFQVIQAGVEIQQYYANWSVFHWFVVVTGYALSWSAVIALFVMKRMAVRLWLLVVIWVVIDDVQIAASAHWRALAGVEGLVGLAVGIAMVVAIYFYARRLDTRGYLT